MSTSAESAQNWLATSQPTNQQIEEMMQKLNQRIEHSGATEDALQGSIEALDVLTQELVRRETGLNTESLDTSEVALDFGALDQGEVNIAQKAQTSEEKTNRLAQIRQAISQIEQS